MLDIDKLKKEREQAFDIWFEKWWEKEKLESKIKKANLTGYRGYVVTMSDYEANEQIWMRKEEFLRKLQDMLPNFRVEYKYAKNILTKNDFLYGIRIEW